MMEWLGALRDWYQALPHQWAVDLIRSAGLVLGLALVRGMLVRSLARQPQISLETRRRWSVSLRNGFIVLGLLGLVAIWSAELQTLAVSMVAIAAALALSLKELLMCFSGSFLRTMTKSYSVGDRIEIAAFRGRVIDINLVCTTILEIGPRHDAHQQTGRAVSFPNSLLLSSAVIREDYTGDFIVHVITVPVDLKRDLVEAERILQEAADHYCAPFLADARKHMEAVEAMRLVDTPSVEPRISIQIADEKICRLNLRIAVPRLQKHRIEQAILHRYVAEFFGHGPADAAQK